MAIQASLEGTSDLYNHNFKFSEGESRSKNLELMDLGKNHHHDHQQHHNSGLMRYCSAPSSFFANIVGETGANGVVSASCENFQSPEVENMFARFMSSSSSSDPELQHQFRDRFMKQEQKNSAMQQNINLNGAEILYRNTIVHDSHNDNAATVEGNTRGPFAEMNTVLLENSMQLKTNNGNCSNLLRQSSSPAGFFSNLTTENNGFAASRDVMSFGHNSGINVKVAPLANGMNNHINFSNGSSSSSKMNTSGSGTKRQHRQSFSNGVWDDSLFSGSKGAKNDDRNIISVFSSFEIQNTSGSHRSKSSEHHLSWPISSFEIDAMENCLNFQETIPYKTRAKRGCATHPRSIAERVRRTRISERIRRLQKLFPNIDKQTTTADMLEMAVEYIKHLQKQVQTLTECKAKCICSS